MKKIIVIVILAVGVGVALWLLVGGKGAVYHAVYLRTGDMYFGRLTRFPYFGLTNVNVLQVNQGDTENPLVIQKFTNVFWGPQDFLKINRDQVVWVTKLEPQSQLAQLLALREKEGPAAAQGGQVEQPQQGGEAPVIAPAPTPALVPQEEGE